MKNFYEEFINVDGYTVDIDICISGQIRGDLHPELGYRFGYDSAGRLGN